MSSATTAATLTTTTNSDYLTVLGGNEKTTSTNKLMSTLKQSTPLTPLTPAKMSKSISGPLNPMAKKLTHVKSISSSMMCSTSVSAASTSDPIPPPPKKKPVSLLVHSKSAVPDFLHKRSVKHHQQSLINSDSIALKGNLFRYS